MSSRRVGFGFPEPNELSPRAGTPSPDKSMGGFVRPLVLNWWPIEPGLANLVALLRVSCRCLALFQCSSAQLPSE